MTDYLDENLFEKELIILKVIEVKNAVFAIIFFFFLIMDSNFKILYAMVVMI